MGFGTRSASKGGENDVIDETRQLRDVDDILLYRRIVRVMVSACNSPISDVDTEAELSNGRK